jgi:protein phosphatase
MFGKTDVGRHRKHNEDSLLFDAPSRMAIVADGIGGRNAGEVASAMVVKSIANAVINFNKNPGSDMRSFMRSTVSSVNNKILAKASSSAKYSGMATTLNWLMFSKTRAYIAHMGDSRTYLYYKKQLWQLTLDHNIENYACRGWLSDNSLLENKNTEALVKAIGLSEDCDVDIYSIGLTSSQLFLTCSDGVTSMLSDSAILSLIKANEHQVNKLPEILVEAANHEGGKDNISAIVTAVKRG